MHTNGRISCLAYLETILPGKATLNVCNRGPSGVKVADGFEVSSASVLRVVFFGTELPSRWILRF